MASTSVDIADDSLATDGTASPIGDLENLVDNPPPYTSSIDDQPPSYDSIFQKVKKIQQESSGSVGCLRDVGQHLCRSVGGLVTLSILLGIPITMIVMGSLYLAKCSPMENMVPVYLIVGGSVIVIYMIILLLRRLVSLYAHRKHADHNGDHNDEQDEEENSSQLKHVFWKAFDAAVNLFSFAWFIVGNYYIYKTWENQPYKDCDREYCCVFLLFGFWFLNTIYMLCGCCTCCGVWLVCLCAACGRK